MANNADEKGIIKIDNLNYLKQQIKGYGTAADRVNETLGEDDDYLELYNETIMDEEGTEGSGDDDKEDKAGFIPIPMNKDPQGVVATHLQRLSQLIKAMSNEQNKTTELGPNDLNQFLAAHKIQIGIDPMYGLPALNRVSVPIDGKIHPSTMAEILDLQEKIQKLGALRDSLSTPAPPVNNVVSNSGYYKPDATTLHIKTSNSVKSPRFPDIGVAPSQIVVNRPEGSVLFSLSHAGPIVSPDKEPYISEETLKTVLELSHQMASTNQPPALAGYDHKQTYVQPLIRPVYYNLPIQELPAPISYDSAVKDSFINLKDSYNNLKDSYNNLKDSYSSLKDNYSVKNSGYTSVKDTYANSHTKHDDITMQKISSINGYLDTDEHFVGEVPATIIHNHIPITISNPNPLNSILSGISSSTSTTTTQPESSEIDSYGSKVPAYSDHKDADSSTKYTDLNNYYPYPPFNEGEPVQTGSPTYDSYQPNKYASDTKHYIQISHSKPEEEVYFGMHHSHVRPVLNLDSFSGPTNPTIYNPSPHLSDYNVNDYVNVDAKPFSTLQPTEYKPFKNHQSHLSSSGHFTAETNSNENVYPHNGGQSRPGYITKMSSASTTAYGHPPKMTNYHHTEALMPANNYNPSSNVDVYESESGEQQQSYLPNIQQYQSPMQQQYDVHYQAASPQSYIPAQSTTQTPSTKLPSSSIGFNSAPDPNIYMSQEIQSGVHQTYNHPPRQPTYINTTPEPSQAPPQPIRNYDALQSYNDDNYHTHHTSHHGQHSYFQVHPSNNQLNENSINYGSEDNQQLEEYDSGSYEAADTDDDHHHHRPNLNSDENVTNLLSNLAPQTTQPLHTDKKPLFQYNPSASDNHKQFVNLGGNFISLETYQNSIEPFLHDGALLNSNIEVLTCATGVRQANSTDCTKYFVCNSSSGKVLSYTCPPYTAFNGDTKICNAKTYAECVPGGNKAHVSITENKRIQQEAQQALIEANRVKADALKQQKLASMIKLQTQKILSQASQHMKKPIMRPAKASANSNTSPHKHHSSSSSHKNKHHASSSSNSSGGSNSSSSNSSDKKRKRRIACRSEGKLPDKLSAFNYFICFKDKTGKMKARKMTCPSGLMFCASTKMCTSYKRCSAQKL